MLGVGAALVRASEGRHGLGRRLARHIDFVRAQQETLPFDLLAVRGAAAK